jgi:hypothetical protein
MTKVISIFVRLHFPFHFLLCDATSFVCWSLMKDDQPSPFAASNSPVKWICASPRQRWVDRHTHDTFLARGMSVAKATARC